jgi:short-subunit dehydrogenase
MNVSGKVVIVTGASSGIGLATARLLARAGASVALVARSQQKLRDLAEELPRSLAVPADMSREDQIGAMVTRVVDHYGKVDILINCAGRGYDAPLERIDIGKFREILDLDVLGPVIAMQAVIPIMRKQGGGMIVNVSSGTALMYLPNMGPYSSLKRALAALSLTAREELKNDNIVVSVFYPYMTLTAFEENTLKEDIGTEWEGDDGEELQPPDSAEFAAEKILEAIESEEPEVFAHDWMKNLR